MTRIEQWHLRRHLRSQYKYCPANDNLGRESGAEEGLEIVCLASEGAEERLQQSFI